MYTQRAKCPHCDKLLISPMGNSGSPYLLVGDFPGYHETMQGLPFAFRQKQNQTLSGDILKDELTRVGIMLNQVLVTNLWPHQQAWKMEIVLPKTPRGKPKEKKVEACPLHLHVDALVRSFEGKTHVLLMGSHVTEALLGVKVNVVSGTRVKVPGVSTKVKFFASPNPSLAFSQPIGELRLAFKRFSEEIRS